MMSLKLLGWLYYKIKGVNYMKDFFKNNWDKCLSIFISFVATAFSIFTLFNQHNFKKQYNETSNQVIINSIKLAEYDLNLLKMKINLSQKGSQITYQQLNFQVDSLKKNLNTLNEVDVTKLPNDKSLNYQVYVQDLNAIIYKRESDLNALKNLSHKQENGEDLLELNDVNLETMRDSIDTDLKVLSVDKEVIEENGDLYSRVYKHNLDTMKSLENGVVE